MKNNKFNWDAYRRGETGASALEILALLNSRDALLKTLEKIKQECPDRPTKPIVKRICELVNTGLREAQNGE